MLVNLTGNAIKLTEHGEVVLHISRSGGDEAVSMLRFADSDTGIGINPEQLAALFKP